MKHAAAPTKCRAETSNAMRGGAPPATAPPAASCKRRDGGGGRVHALARQPLLTRPPRTRFQPDIETHGDL